MECIGVLGVRSDWSTETKRAEVFVSPTGVLFKGYIRHAGTGGQGRWLITRAVGEVMSGTSICL